MRYALGMKQCRRCMRTLDRSLFSASKVNKDGLHSYCKACHNSYVRERYQNKPRTDEDRAKQRAYSRLYRYGVSQEKYDEMMQEQNNACAVCKVEFGDKFRPNVDHDHRCCPGVVTCGRRIRGILCSGCNAFAGMIETRFSTHEAMFSYLHLHHNSRWGTI